MTGYPVSNNTMKLNYENFKTQIDKLQPNEYFIIEAEDGYNFTVARLDNISDYYITGYWELTKTLKMFDYHETDVEDIYKSVLNDLDPAMEMDSISDIMNLDSED